MNDRQESSGSAPTRLGSAFLILALGCSVLAACESILEVELPSQLTDQAVENPEAAGTLVNSVIAMFECAYSSLSYQAMGHEDVWERIGGQTAPSDYSPFPAEATAECDNDLDSGAWYQNVQTSRAMASQTYDRLENEWTVQQVPDKERYQAILALYAGANLDVLGEFFCEMAIDGGGLMSPGETLAMSEQWIETALDHIQQTGDFPLPHGVSSSAETTARALRARVRWAMGDTDGALADAQTIPQGFEAFVTRGPGPQRRNKIAVAGYQLPFSSVLGVNDWWTGEPNPVTDQPWPSPIPFTGYRDLGILSDGRAVRSDGVPIRVGVDAGAEDDSRVGTEEKNTSAGEPGYAPTKYTQEDQPIPLVSWREMWLIRAELEGGQTSIDLVNDLRNEHGLTPVTYADPSDPQEIEYMVLEEKRRELWLEGGRWWSTKIQNVDLLWFPRNQGLFPTNNFPLQGGVRLILPNAEFDNNQNLTRDDRATLCASGERPVGFF